MNALNLVIPKLQELYGIGYQGWKFHCELDALYVYPAAYGILDQNEADLAADLIVINNEVVKDRLNWFGLGYKF